jgi:PhnB protein
MANKPTPLPEGYHTATPFLIVSDGAAALDFYAKVFGAGVHEKMTTPDGRIMHAELRIGDSMIMLGEHSNVDARDPKLLPRVSIYLYVPDVDGTFGQAIAGGAREVSPLRDQFYGNREGGVEDPWGIVWWIATRVEELTPAEIERRAATARPS